mmetsp:Transcript_4303/g.12402  ORF Transcript_4303/g.12402 Transcript_4303/m.12402 type:complete len:212 (-) Transcript_4303:592-1227(-)
MVTKRWAPTCATAAASSPHRRTWRHRSGAPPAWAACRRGAPPGSRPLQPCRLPDWASRTASLRARSCCRASTRSTRTQRWLPPRQRMPSSGSSTATTTRTATNSGCPRSTNSPSPPAAAPTGLGRATAPASATARSRSRLSTVPPRTARNSCGGCRGGGEAWAVSAVLAVAATSPAAPVAAPPSAPAAGAALTWTCPAAAPPPHLISPLRS